VQKPIAPIAIETLDATGGGSLVARAVGKPSVFADADRGPDDLAAILYTSGTTGRSKGAMLTHRNLASNADTLVDYWRFGETDVLLHALPLYHTHGLFTAALVVMLAGGSILFLPKFDADQVIVATSERSEASELPNFAYEAGGLEDPHIRALVCQYLEGGEEAFRKLARCGSSLDNPHGNREHTSYREIRQRA